MKETLEKLVNALYVWYESESCEKISDLAGDEINDSKDLVDVYNAYLEAKRELERIKDSDIKIIINGGHEVTIPTK